MPKCQLHPLLTSPSSKTTRHNNTYDSSFPSSVIASLPPVNTTMHMSRHSSSPPAASLPPVNITIYMIARLPSAYGFQPSSCQHNNMYGSLSLFHSWPPAFLLSTQYCMMIHLFFRSWFPAFLLSTHTIYNFSPFFHLKFPLTSLLSQRCLFLSNLSLFNLNNRIKAIYNIHSSSSSCSSSASIPHLTPLLRLIYFSLSLSFMVPQASPLATTRHTRKNRRLVDLEVIECN